MTEKDKKLKALLNKTAETIAYPETPDLARDFAFPKTNGSAHQRRFIGYGAIALLLLGMLIFTPSVRARLVEVLQIGGITILLPEVNASEQGQGRNAPHSIGAGEFASEEYWELPTGVSLAEAENRLAISIPFPSYPADIGVPDKITLEDFGTGLFAVLGWQRKDLSIQTDVFIYVVGPDSVLTKAPQVVDPEITVKGQPAVYTQGSYLLFSPANPDSMIRIEGPVLIWQEEELTFRLEADLPLDELIRIAESLE